MTDELTPDEEALRDEARATADEPPKPVDGTADLPDEVKDGDLSDEEDDE